ncbi:MAG: SDR family oxidoreductase [Loktanella sp.]|nr:SDR family oxidoreductase [Loktanella sp.]
MTGPKVWALVTGAGSGIGAALAAALVTEGVGVVLVGRRAAHLETVAKPLGPAALVLPGDITRPEDRDRIKATLDTELDRRGAVLRFVVHNAGIGDPSQNFASTDPETLARAFDVNVVAPLALTQALLPMLRQAAPARVLLVGAGIADRPQPGTGIYGISKAATARLMRQMAMDFDHEGDATAPAVALFQPGLVETEGLHAHVAAASACGLPHAAWLAGRLENGDAQTPETTATLMSTAMLRLPVAEFHGRQLQHHDLSPLLG